MGFVQYILISAACLSIAFIAFRLSMRKVTHFRHLRVYLIGSVTLSLLLPLFSVSLDYSALFRNNTLPVDETGYVMAGNIQPTEELSEPGFFSANHELLLIIYSLIALVLIIRLLIQFTRLVRLYYKSDRKHDGRNVILYTRHINSPFSFFRWIFIPQQLAGSDEKESIIIHESIHATQYHSIDNMLIEFVTAVMWFNPLAWMMKRSIHLVHEYLADEGALDTGIDRLRYQALLINQVTEEKLICLSSNFNHSLIKKRMIMMTKSKNYRAGKLKILTLLPLSAILFLMVALLNGLFPQEIQANIPDIKTLNQFDPLSSEEPLMQDDTTKKKTYYLQIISKDTNDSTEKVTVTCKSDSKLPDSLVYVVDGSYVKDINSIKPDSIRSINVIKSDNVIIIRTSKSEGDVKGKSVILETGNGIPDNTIIYIDGRQSTKEALKSLDPEQIKTINVKKSGDSEAVMEITTKEKK